MKGILTGAAIALAMMSQVALAQVGGPSEKAKECTGMIYPKGDYNPCDPSQCIKVCQCSGGRDCSKNCERESKILFGPNSCRANIPAERLKK